MVELKKPMLLCKDNPDVYNLKYPVAVLPKLDGIRCLTTKNGPVSRTLKAIPNKYIQEKLKSLPPGLDGELIVGNFTDKDVYRKTNSAVMSHEGEPNEFTYYVFDLWNSTLGYSERQLELQQRDLGKFSCYLEPTIVFNAEALLEFEEECLEQGFEGIIIRDLIAPYKQGRTTMREHNAYKLKRYEDDEATIVGFISEFENNNEAVIDERGYIKRSIKKSGLAEKESVGALIVDSPKWGIFNIGTGFTEVERKNMWSKKEELIGKTIKFKYFPVGIKDKPRHPVFLGFRNMEVDG